MRKKRQQYITPGSISQNFGKHFPYLPKFLFTGINGNLGGEKDLGGEKETGGGKRNFRCIIYKIEDLVPLSFSLLFLCLDFRA
jgi:hypothetical protein